MPEIKYTGIIVLEVRNNFKYNLGGQEMAKKEVVICDLCGKVADKLENHVTINKVEYKEVCDECAAKFNDLVKKIQNPPLSQYMKRKSKMISEEK